MSDFIICSDNMVKLCERKFLEFKRVVVVHNDAHEVSSFTASNVELVNLTSLNLSELSASYKKRLEQLNLERMDGDVKQKEEAVFDPDRWSTVDCFVIFGNLLGTWQMREMVYYMFKSMPEGLVTGVVQASFNNEDKEVMQRFMRSSFPDLEEAFVSWLDIAI
jgi:hypothetical protein